MKCLLQQIYLLLCYCIKTMWTAWIFSLCGFEVEDCLLHGLFFVDGIDPFYRCRAIANAA